MNFKIFFLIFIIYMNSYSNIITFFIKPYPMENVSTIDADQIHSLCNIINCQHFNLPINFGIFCSYLGYLDLSDLNGQVTFPRKTVKDTLNLLITNDIEPIFMFKNTIAYWKIFDNSLAKMYKIERKQDLETKLFYWNLTERKIPNNNQIPLHTIIVLADANDFVVPLGASLTSKSAQLVLPNIYVKPNQNYLKNAIFTLTIKPFFSTIKNIFKERPIGFAQQIID